MRDADFGLIYDGICHASRVLLRRGGKQLLRDPEAGQLFAIPEYVQPIVVLAHILDSRTDLDALRSSSARRY